MGNESFKLGGNIELTGFRSIDSSSMSVIKKIVGTYAKRLAELTKKLEILHITLKPIHEREKSEKYELHVKVIDNGKVYASKTTDRNLLTAIDSALNKIVNEIHHNI